MKPSERIRALLPAWCSDAYAVSKNPFVRALLIALDEEAAQPKYACPKCHRVVDDLFKLDGDPGFDWLCEYCISDYERDHARFLE